MAHPALLLSPVEQPLSLATRAPLAGAPSLMLIKSCNTGNTQEQGAKGRSGLSSRSVGGSEPYGKTLVSLRWLGVREHRGLAYEKMRLRSNFCGGGARKQRQ